MASDKKTTAEKFSEYVDVLIDERQEKKIKDGAIVSEDGKFITSEDATKEWEEQMMLLQVLSAVRIAQDDGIIQEIYYLLKREYPRLMGDFGIRD